MTEWQGSCDRAAHNSQVLMAENVIMQVGSVSNAAHLTRCCAVLITGKPYYAGMTLSKNDMFQAKLWSRSANIGLIANCLANYDHKASDCSASHVGLQWANIDETVVVKIHIRNRCKPAGQRAMAWQSDVSYGKLQVLCSLAN